MTDDHDTAAALRHSEARLAGILKIAADAIIAIDEQHRIIIFNQAAEAAFGYTAAEMLGRPLEVLIPDRFRSRHADHIQAFSDSGVVTRRMGERREVFGRHKSGREFSAEASISKIQVDGESTFTVVLRDITARKAAEAALVQANRDLEARVSERTAELRAEMQRREETQAALARAQRMEAFGQLTGGIAHDFNNLLTVISGNQELLEMRLQNPKDLELLKRAQDATEMGARLIARLLTFARRRHLAPTLIDLNEQISGMVELLRRSIGEQITLTTILSPRLWKVRADASEIENAILNLAINARDAMPNGGIIAIETADCTIEEGEIGGEVKLAAGDYVRISVADTGTGMTPEIASRAFEPFFTTKAPGKGTGLGLSTIHGFAQQSGGTATIYSEPGLGTTVSIYLPRAREEPQVTQPSTSARATPPRAHGETILVVEDNPDVRGVTRARLLALGYAVIEADTGPAAVEILRSQAKPIALVLSDVVMPGGMSGYDVVRWIAANSPAVKAMLTSGFPDEIARAQSDLLPSVKLLRKPHSLADLAAKLREVLDG